MPGRPNISPDSEQTLLCEELLKVFRAFPADQQEKIIQMMKIWKAE